MSGKMEIGPVRDGQELGEVFVHGDDPGRVLGEIESVHESREAAIEAAQASVGAAYSIDLSDHGPMAKVTRGEVLLYSADLAPVVREVGTAFTAVRRSMTRLSRMVNEARDLRGRLGEDATAATDEPDVARWQAAFNALSTAHDALMEAYPEVAQIGMDAARAERYVPDRERTALTRSS